MTVKRNNNIKSASRKVKWYIPILFTAALGVLGWGGQQMIAASDRNAADQVWKRDVETDIDNCQKQDTLFASEQKSMELLIKEFILEVRNDRKQKALIDDLQERQINMLAEKTNTKKEMEKLKQQQEELKDMLEEKALLKKIDNDNVIYDDLKITDSLNIVSVPCNKH